MKTAERLYQGITEVDESYIREAEPRKRRRNGLRRAILVGCTGLLVAAVAFGIGEWQNLRENPAEPVAEAGYYADMPGGIRPAVQIHGKFYYYTGWNHHKTNTGVPFGDVVVMANGETYLPEGYTPVMEITEVTESAPTSDGQLQAGFQASGMIYENPDSPEVVYICMTSDEYADKYTRFVSDTRDAGDSIAYQGLEFRITVHIEVCARVQSLPEGAVKVGTLQYLGDDAMPTADLTTNASHDLYGRALQGREVYADPADPSCVYVWEPNERIAPEMYAVCPLCR